MTIEGYLNKGFKQICADDLDLYIYAFSRVDARIVDIVEYLKIKRKQE